MLPSALPARSAPKGVRLVFSSDASAAVAAFGLKPVPMAAAVVPASMARRVMFFMFLVPLASVKTCAGD